MSEPWSVANSTRSDSRSAPRIEPTEFGVAVVDPIEQCREALWVRPGPVSPRPVSDDAIPAPVSTVVRLPGVDELRFNRMTTFLVRTRDWDLVDRFEEPGSETYTGDLVINVFSQVKLYLRCEGTITIHGDPNESWVDLSEAGEVYVGARSIHSRPSGTVRVRDRPEAVMQGVSALSSAVKTTSPDRSWPSLRGHPPLIDVGETTRIPEGLSPPATGIQVAVPRDCRAIFPVAPLAYYLGAEVVPGVPPRIETEGGFEYRLTDPDAGPTDYESLEGRVERVLRQVLFLECLARKHGLMNVPIYEREAVADRLPIDLANFHDLDPAARLTAALAVDYGTIAEYVPQWPSAAHLVPSADQAELLPHLVNDLSLVRTRKAASVSDAPATGIGGTDRANSPGSGGGVCPPDGPGGCQYVQLTDDHDDVLNTIWGGQATPIGASKLVPEGFRNRLEGTPSSPPIDVAVVCNDAQMAEELEVAEHYRDTEYLSLDVSIYEGLSTSGFRTLLEAQGADFLHYIGHADERGLWCTDGYLDLSTLDSVETDVFLFNACQSYGQGIRLVERGSIAGVVTMEEVSSVVAADIGSLLARLLGMGYQLRAALAIVDEHRVTGNSYLVVGDGSAAVAESEIAPLYRIDRVDDDTFEFQVHAYAANLGVGGVASNYFEGSEYSYYLVGNATPTVEVSQDRLAAELDRGDLPVKVEGEPGIEWCSEMDLDDVQ